MIELDSEIISQCKKNDRRAQMRLYTAFYKRVYNACYRVLNNSSEAEDAMQESFLKAFSGLDSYNDSVPFEAWLVRIAINTSIDKLRKRNMEFICLDENIKYEPIDADDDEDWEQITEKVEQVKSAMNKLSEAHRLVISLYLIEGYDHREIAELLNITPGAARVQYMRAKQKLIQLI